MCFAVQAKPAYLDTPNALFKYMLESHSIFYGPSLEGFIQDFIQWGGGIAKQVAAEVANTSGCYLCLVMEVITKRTV